MHKLEPPPPPVWKEGEGASFSAAPHAANILVGLGQEVLDYVGNKTVQLQSDEVEKVSVARLLYSTMSRSQVAKVVGITSPVELSLH